MNFHETVRGQRFFDYQLPKLISALQDVSASLKAPRPMIPADMSTDMQEFLTRLYYATFDLETAPDHELRKRCSYALSTIQEDIRSSVDAEVWQKIEHSYTTIATRTASEREQAYAAGFRIAMTMLACGLSASVATTENGGV